MKTSTFYALLTHRRSAVTLERYCGTMPVLHHRYTISVQVRKGFVRGLLDDKEVCQHNTDGSDLSMHELWSLPEPDQMGLVTWAGDTVFHNVEIRHLSDQPAKIAKADSPKSPPAMKLKATERGNDK